MTYFERLEKAIRDLHGGNPKHLESVPIEEVFQGKVMWTGIVEVFSLEGNPRANRCYAWSAKKGTTEQFTAVLSVPPIDTPRKAVQASVVAAQRARN